MDGLNNYIQIRVSVYEKHRLKWLAKKYADGNLSLYLIYAALNIDRKRIKPNDIKDSKRNRLKSQRLRKRPQKVLNDP
jgi:hypothetical protein